MSLITIITMISVVGSIYGGLAVMIGLTLTSHKRQPSTEKEQEKACDHQEKVSRTTQEC